MKVILEKCKLITYNRTQKNKEACAVKKMLQTENLILSYETASNPFDEMKAKKIVKEYFT